MTEAGASTEGNETATAGGEPSVSQRLIDARVGEGLSQKDVADQLYLTTTFIRYLEDGDFHKIPKPAFIKGYLRSYARVVGLPADEIVAAFDREQHLTPPQPAIANVTARTDSGSGFGGAIVQTGMMGLVGLLIVGAVVWWIAADEEATPVVRAPESAATTASSTPVEQQIGPATRSTGAGAGAAAISDELPAADGVEDTSIEPGDTSTDAGMETDPGPADQPAELATAEVEVAMDEPATRDDQARAEAESVPVQIERETEGDTTFITVYAGGDTEMGFEFADDCWIEIRDASGNSIYADLNRNGSVMSVYGQAPFDILLGRAPAVTMTYNGEPVDIERFTTSDDTARIKTVRL